MKTILSGALVLFALGFSGCAVGPGYRTVINPFDWRDVSPSETVSVNNPPAAVARPVGPLFASNP